MMTLVYGGSGSGKSEYAEHLAFMSKKREAEGKLYYLATMQVYDEESRRRINRHRNLRAGKGFITIEQERDISKALQKGIGKLDVVLLECLSNLVANEIFQEGQTFPIVPEKVATYIYEELLELAKQCRHLVIVSNDIFSDGCQYDEMTRDYIHVLGLLHQFLAKDASKIMEVVYGIPVVIKSDEREDTCTHE